MPFKDSEVKVSRARQHLCELQDTLKAYESTVHFSVSEYSREDLAKIGKNAFVAFAIEFNAPPFPDVIFVIVGDILHQLRSALDVMAAALARANEMSDGDVAFPIAENSSDLHDKIRATKFRKCGVAAVSVLSSIELSKEKTPLLWALQELNNKDKHRNLIVPNRSLLFPIFDLKERRIVPNSAKTTCVWHNECSLAGRPVLDTLEEMVIEVENVIQAFHEIHHRGRETPMTATMADSTKSGSGS